MKKNLLIIYLSRHQQSYKISQYLAEHLDATANITLCAIEDVKDMALDDFDAIVVGASIRFGRFPKILYQFIDTYKDVLNAKPSAYFGVNLVARKDNKNTPSTNAYMKKFVRLSAWTPDLIAVFAGAVRYSRYNFLEKTTIQLIMAITGGHTDTSSDVEYTPWDKVDEFAQQIQETILIAD